MRKRFFIFLAVSLLLACFAFPGYAAGDGWVEVPMDFTLKENQSGNVDATVYMQYCFMAAAHITADMTIEAFEAYMEGKRLYFAERTREKDVGGRPVTEYRFLPTLALRLSGDPIQSAALLISCPEHSAAHVELPVSTFYTDGNAEAGLTSYADMYAAKYGVQWDGQPLSDQTMMDWTRTWGLNRCHGRYHSMDNAAQAALIGFASLCTLACPGMTLEGVQALLDKVSVQYETGRMLDHDEDSKSLWIVQDDLYKRAELALVYAFFGDRLTQAVLVMLPPECADMFESPLVYDESARDPAKSYSMGEYAPGIVTRLEQSWYAGRTGQE